MATKPSQMQYTKYEAARIIGARALQISMNAPILLSLKKQELEVMEYDSLRIAEKEFRSGVLPITVKRPFPVMKEVEEKEEKDSATTETETGGKEETEEKEEGKEVEGKEENKSKK